MQHNNVQDDLQDGFEPGQLPPVGPDGALELTPPRKMTSPPPRLCEAGPCVNYHRFEIQLDVTRPIAARVEPGGKLSGEAPPMPFHVRTFHYCYPTPGVETDLGELPVLSCNKWMPVDPQMRELDDGMRAEFLATDAGQQYQTALDAWIANQQDAENVAVESSSIDDKEQP